MPRKKLTVETVTRVPSNPGILRKRTGLYSLDLALSGGLPLFSSSEWSGPSHSGKSTLVDYLAGIVAAPDYTIANLDYETSDNDYPVNVARLAGWVGAMYAVADLDEKEGKPLLHEDMMDRLVDQFMQDKQIHAVIVDSIGAIVPAAEFEGSVGDAVMGGRARIVARFMRKMTHLLKTRPSHMFCVNHVHPKIGGFGPPGQTSTSGGEAMKYLPAIRASVWSQKEDTHWVVNGKMNKVRYRNKALQKRDDFQVVILPDYGIHAGLTAVKDCILFGLAEMDRVVKLNGESYGHFKNMVESYDDAGQFEPFKSALANSGILEGIIPDA